MKKLLSLLISVLMLSAMYAQNAKSVGLADSDVKNWTKNCVLIQKEFEKLGIDTNEKIFISDTFYIFFAFFACPRKHFD